MKRYLFATVLFFACTGLHAQSISFEDLLNLTSMNQAQSRDFLSVSKGYKASGTQTLNGKTYQLYQNTKSTSDNTETVLVGIGVKTSSGNTTHEIIYNSTHEPDLDSLLVQAKKSTLTLVFQGADLSNNIYRFDNSLFRASISRGFDKKSGNVNVQQK